MSSERGINVKHLLKDERGFTLIEMMIVLLVISVLLFIAIPNVTKQSGSINAKGCEAFVNIIVVKYNLMKTKKDDPAATGSSR